jgi:hypothetical protein
MQSRANCPRKGSGLRGPAIPRLDQTWLITIDKGRRDRGWGASYGGPVAKNLSPSIRVGKFVVGCDIYKYTSLSKGLGWIYAQLHFCIGSRTTLDFVDVGS